MRKKGNVLLSIMALGTMCLYRPALAQTTAHGQWVVDPTGAATSGFVYDPPPAGFDPLTASEADLRDYGFPPRPNPSEEERYNIWEKIASVQRIRPQLTFSNHSYGPATAARMADLTGSSSITSDNWSGYVATASSGTFAKNDNYVYSEWTIPALSQGTACTPLIRYAAQWVGFDGGFVSSDVLQAGTEGFAFCSGGSTQTGYSIWYEWYPANATFISPSGAPGDLMSVEVLYSTSSPHGTAYISNLTTKQGTTVSFNPPSGTTYVGNSVEWVVERPTVNGGLTDLADYTNTVFTSAHAYNGTTYLPSGPVPPGGVIYNVTMICPPWVGLCAHTTDISEVSLVGSEELSFNPLPPAK